MCYKIFVAAPVVIAIVIPERLNLASIGVFLAMANVTIKVPQAIPAMMTAFYSFIRKSPSSLTSNLSQT